MAPLIRRPIQRLSGVAAALALVLSPQPAIAAAAPIELAVKATFVVKFASYITWPEGAFADPAAPLVVCVGTGEPLDGLIDRAAAGQSAGSHPIVVRRSDAIGAASGCHIAVLGGDRRAVAATLAAIGDAPVVTITGTREASDRGVVHFEVAGGRVRFHIDEMAASRKGLGISSKLLALALSVRARGGR